jgi:hypothetical protein
MSTKGNCLGENIRRMEGERKGYWGVNMIEAHYIHIHITYVSTYICLSIYEDSSMKLMKYYLQREEGRRKGS